MIDSPDRAWTPRQVANARAYLESQGVGVPADRDKIHTPCRRCGDERYFRYWAHVAGGMCFECGGAGGRDVHVVVYARRLKARRRRAAAEEERRRRAAAAEERAAADREMRAAAEEERRLERQREWCEAHGHGRITFAELDAQRAAQSEHVGALGERRDFAATVEFVTGWDGPWGYTRLYGFRDDGGNALVYRSGHALRYAGDSELVERGHRVRFTATVKEHSVRKGERQTRVARPAKVSRG